MIDTAPRDIDVVADNVQLARLGQAARMLAAMAGSRLLAIHDSSLQVDFKQPHRDSAPNSNPVSDADREIETLLRSRLRADFPNHAVIGEEAPATNGSSPFTWVIDPLDGTTNFINGLPLFAVSVGLLFNGRPLAGAIWCAATHEFHPGVYHAINGGTLQFDGRPLARRTQQSWRGLAAEPGRAPTYGASWDTRVIACATLEFAWVAAGLLRLAYIPRPALWDVAAGIVLLRAAQCQALSRRDNAWRPFADFGQQAPLADWSEPLLIGATPDLERAMEAQ